MKRMSLFQRACPVAVFLVGLSVPIPVSVAAEELIFRACADYCAKIDGTYAPDARFFQTEPKGRLMVDLPSLSAGAVIELKARKVVTLPRSSIRREADESTIRLANQVAPDAAASAVSMDGPVWRFQIGDAEVTILKAAECRSAAAPAPAGGPMADDPAARKCLHQSARPIAANAGCAKGAYLKNSCDLPVIAVIQSTQHLFSGTLPETSSIVVPPGMDYPLGCGWPSGAMAPTDFTVLAAGFAEKRTGPRPGEQPSTGH
jgi:hypothetical protein